MTTPGKPDTSRRESMLTVMLTGLVAAGILFFLIMVSAGFVLYVLLVVSGIVGIGFLHYITWGYTMTQEANEEQPTHSEEEETWQFENKGTYRNGIGHGESGIQNRFKRE